MRPNLKQFGIVSGFILLGLLLLINALVTKNRIDVQAEDARWLLHSRLVLAELEQAESTLKDAETGQRGYLLTGDAKYLAPYQLATAEIGPRIDNLANLTADSPLQQQYIAELRDLTREKMDELAQTVSLYRSGNADQAKAIVLSDKGLLAMDRLRQAFAAMRLEETRLDGARSAQYQQSIRATATSILLATLVALLGLIALANYIVRVHVLRERHAQALRMSEELYRTTLTSIGDAVIMTDQHGIVTFLNSVAEKLTGRNITGAKGKKISEVFPIFNEVTGQGVEDPVKKVMELGIVVGLANHTVLKNRDGSLIPIEDSAAPIRDDHGALTGVVLVFRDVTAERKSDELLRKTEKLAAAARLSATVAHEINNPLAAVVNLIYIAKNMQGTPAALVQHLAMAEQELERVAHITRQTLAFYRESGAPEEMAIADLVESVLRLYSNKITAKNIAVKRAYDECGPVVGVLGELRQAVSNLIANAIDAVHENGANVVGARVAQGANSGMIEITVADDGPGIPAKDLGHIFEPFFTTKKDVGTGLGLWATKTIVERHGGSIAVRSPDDGADGARGTTFTIQLPRVNPAAVESATST